MIATFFVIFALVRALGRLGVRREGRGAMMPPVDVPQSPTAALATNCSPLTETTSSSSSLSTAASGQTAGRRQSSVTTVARTIRQQSTGSDAQFSRSDSTVTTASGATLSFSRRGDSTASTVSTSGASEVLLPPDGRRSSEGARVAGNRRSSGRIRRYAPRTVAAPGGRRRTTGRYHSH